MFYKVGFYLVLFAVTNLSCVASTGRSGKSPSHSHSSLAGKNKTSFSRDFSVLKKNQPRAPASSRSQLTRHNWLSSKTGRTNILFATKDPEKLKQFVPSGLFQGEQIIGNWKVILHSPVYFSNEENPDTSKDQPASAIVYSLTKTKNWIPRFAGKGYKFSLIQTQEINNILFILRYWTGTMGCSFIDFSFYPSVKVKNQAQIEYRSTSTVTTNNPLGEICKTDNSLIQGFK